MASFFVSRVDTETNRRLVAIGRDDLKGRLGIANAKLAYQQYKELFAGARDTGVARYSLGMTLLRPRVDGLLPVPAVAPWPPFVHVPA